MLPNVRLMIAATVASIVALMCGFGMFAVFRVNHEPFARLPAATAPLLLVADNAATAPARYALAEPFDARFQLTVKRDAVEQISATVAIADHDEQVDAAAATTTTAATSAMPEETSGEKAEQTAALNATAETSASETPAPTDAETGAAANGAPAPQPETVATMSVSDAQAVAAPADATGQQPEQDTTSPVASAPPATPAPLPAAEVAVNAPAASELSLVPKLSDRVPQPTDDASPADKRARKPTAQKAKRIHATMHLPRVPPVVVLSYAPLRYPRIRYAATPYAPTPEQDFGTSQTVYQYASSVPGEFAGSGAAPVARPRIVARRPRAPNSAIGGPFVSATSR
jgi:hypothetical protein